MMFFLYTEAILDMQINVTNENNKRIISTLGIENNRTNFQELQNRIIYIGKINSIFGSGLITMLILIRRSYICILFPPHWARIAHCRFLVVLKCPA